MVWLSGLPFASSVFKFPFGYVAGMNCYQPVTKTKVRNKLRYRR